MKIETLKRQAREHELSEEWEQALALYRKAAEALRESEEPDIALINRMADLQVRNGDLEGALETYEEAIDLYLEAELPNNAIAICRKMIRNAPGRPEIFRRLGAIRAGQGFVVDARQNYLTYAEMMEARGQRDRALSGLDELVTLVPDDVETRLFLGEHFVARGEVDEGLPHLVHAWAVLKRAGSDGKADELEERIRAIDSDVVLTPPGRQEAAPARDDGGLVGFESTGLESFGDMDPEPDTAGFDGNFDLPETDDGEVEADFDDFDAEPFDESGIDEPDSDEEVVEVAFGDLDVEEDTDSDIPESSDPLPLIGSDEDFGVGGFGDEPADAPRDEKPSLESIRARIATDPDDPAHYEALVAYTYRTNDRGLLLEAFTGLADALMRTGAEGKARSVFEQVLQLDPRNADALRALGRDGPPEEEAEPAPAAADGGEDGVDAGEEDAPADAIAFEDPFDRESAPEADLTEIAEGIEWGLPEGDDREAVAESADAPADGQEDPSFVDLGSMILEEEEETTRWTAAGHEPSGDEDMDFAGMLSEFKEKVARNLDYEDSTSQYDLGSAFKDMGLLDEAISMFQQALRSRPSHLGAIEMMGQCFLEKDDPKMAVRVLSRALDLPRPVEDDLLGIYYYLAEAHQRAGNPEEAREFYEMVFALDINFRDVTDRLRSLR